MMERPLKHNWNTASLINVIRRYFKVESDKRRMDKIKRVSTLPLVGVPYADSPRCGSGITNQPQIMQSPPKLEDNVTNPTKRTPKDFIFGKVIGEGSFSTVYLTKDIHTSKEYAIKVCEKRHIVKERKTQYVKKERDALNKLNSSPYFVKLFCTFQDPQNLYFVMSYAKHGELLNYINKSGAFDTNCARFYAGEILVALEHLKKHNIIHRDLKPENILLDDSMHILITDFGSAKVGSDSQTGRNSDEDESDDTKGQRRNSFVGTAQYVSPELLTEKAASFASDLWAFGCILYQMISGLPPFRARSEYMIFQKITTLEYDFPSGFDPLAKDLVQKLLVLDANKRLGTKDAKPYTSIRAHEFFKGLDFDNLLNTTPPTISPYIPIPVEYNIPDNLEPGLSHQLSRLLGLSESEEASGSQKVVVPQSKKIHTMIDILRDCNLKNMRLAEQAENSVWHQFTEGRLILKQGIINKRKGLFARRRMLLMTEGPKLYYVDPVTMVLKGEIPFTPELSAEPKNFKIFFVHTPGRTYYLDEPEGYALDWCKAIDEIKSYYFS